MSFKPISSQQKNISGLKIKEAKVEELDVQKELVSLEEERIYRSGTVAIKDLIAPSALNVDSSFLQLGDVFLRTIFVISYPDIL